MPKLSAYLSSSSQTDVELDRLKGALKDNSGTQLRLRTDTTGKQQVEPPRSHNKSLDVLRKRNSDHGERQYRWADGSLRSEKPPRNPFAVSSRRSWAPLVRYCRENGGDREYENSGVSLRFGLNVEYSKHMDYLSVLGLEPEQDKDGEFKGFVAGQANPLNDELHAFNSYYKDESDTILAQGGRL